MLCQVLCCHTMSSAVLSHYDMRFVVTQCYVLRCHTMSCVMLSHYVMSYIVTLCHVLCYYYNNRHYNYYFNFYLYYYNNYYSYQYYCVIIMTFIDYHLQHLFIFQIK